MVNPFIVYILAFGGTLLAYGFDWSTLYPRLSGDVVSFFIWTFLAALPLAAVVWPRLACVRRRKSALPGWMTKAMVVGMIADIAYAGGIPLFMVAAGSDFDYSQFGIPTFHVILVTFSSAYAAVRFSDFLISRRTRYLVDALIPLAFSVLTFTRGTAMMSLIAFGFIWLSHHGMPRLRSMIVGVVLGIGALYAFGVLGDIRSPGAIEEVGQPSSAFKKSIVPTPYLWTYIYVTSPLANLQNTVDAGERPNGSAVQFAAAELVPDFIGKRILEAMDVPREDVARVAPTLNAASIYARAFSYMGWGRHHVLRAGGRCRGVHLASGRVILCRAGDCHAEYAGAALHLRKHAEFYRHGDAVVLAAGIRSVLSALTGRGSWTGSP